MRDFPLNAEDLLHMRKGDRGIQGVVAPDPADRDPPMALLSVVSGMSWSWGSSDSPWIVTMTGWNTWFTMTPYSGVSWAWSLTSVESLGKGFIKRR